MAKFIFKLENVLQIKEKIEEQEKINFGNAQAALNDAIMKYEHLVGRKNNAADKLRNLLNNGGSVIDMKQAEEAVEILKMYCKTQLLQVKIEEKNVEIAREKLEEAIKERKTYEKLKENEFEEYKQEMQKKEDLEINELVSYKYSPNIKTEVR